MIELETEAPDSPDTVEVFSLPRQVTDPETGETSSIRVTYSMPAAPRPSVGLRFVWEMKTASEMEAVANLLTSTVGPEAFEALTRAEGMTTAQWGQIQQFVMQVTTGELEPGKGQ